MAKNRAFVRYTKTGKIIPGSMIVTNGSYPKNGTYVEVFTNECCNPNKLGGTSLPLKIGFGFFVGTVSKDPTFVPTLEYTPGAIDANDDPIAVGPLTTVIDYGKGTYLCYVYTDDSNLPKIVNGLGTFTPMPDLAGKCKDPIFGGGGGSLANLCEQFSLNANGSQDCIYQYLSCGESVVRYINVPKGTAVTVCVQQDIQAPSLMSGDGIVTALSNPCT